MTRTTLLTALALLLVGTACSAPTASPDHLTSTTTATTPTAPSATSSADSALTGDVDGDGASDGVALADGVITVTLATGGRLTGPARGATTLVGLADVGGGGRAVIASAPHGRLVALAPPTSTSGSPGRLVVLRAGYGGLVQGRASRTWLGADGLLRTGFLQFPGRQRTPVYAQTWTRDRDLLGLGQTQTALCWDRQASPVPVACAPGQDLRPAVGRRDGLPRLFPAVPDNAVRPLVHPVRIDGVTVQVPGPRGDTHDATVVLTDRDGVRHAAPLPDGPSPVLVTQPLRVRGGARGSFGFVVEQLGGDAEPDTWQVYVWTGATLRHLVAPGGRTPGNLSTGDGGYRTSWVSRAGAVYTRQTTAPGAATRRTPPTRFALTGWQISPTALASADLGRVCLDTFPATARYGRCRAR